MLNYYFLSIRFQNTFLSAIFLSALFLSVQKTQSADGPLTPEQAIASFQLEPGLKVELVVAEPMVVDPVAVAWDETGKMYVAEDRGYPTGPGKGNPPEGQVVLLEDSDGDGKYDKRSVFADGLTFPNGVMPWKGGIYVTCAPNLYYFKDTDGDGKADVKKIVFKGFQDLSTTQLRVSHPTLSIDNWVYLTSGLTAAKVSSPEYPDHPVVFCNRTDFRFKPDTDEFEDTSGTAQFGQTFDNFGRRFICSNRNHNQHVVMQSRYLKRNPNLTFSEIAHDTPDHGAACKLFPLSHNITTAASHTGFFTSACGVTVYNGTALPENYRGNSFTCEPAGNLVHHDVLKPSGNTFIASRAYEDREFIASADNWFRPVNLATGPDGALYLCDMYRKTIEHPEYLPEATRKITDFTSGKDKGRIYKITATDFTGRARHSVRAENQISKDGAQRTDAPYHIGLDKASPKELCSELENPNRWWSMTAHRLLIEKKNLAAIPFLKTLSKNGKSPEARVHALRILDEFGALEEKQIQNALADKNENVREQGILLAEPRLEASPELTKAVLKLADDSNARVRFQCALSLGENSDAKIIPALAKIAARDAADKWTRAATLSSIGTNANQFLNELVSRDPWGKTSLATVPPGANSANRSDGLLPLMNELGRILGSDTNSPQSTLRRLMPASTTEKGFNWQLALLGGFADGLRASKGNNVILSLMTLVQLGSSDIAQKIEIIMKRAEKNAADSQQPVEQRLIAIGFLSHADFSAAGDTLQKLVEPQESSEIQLAAVRALGQMPNPAVGAVLTQKERWGGYTPPIRDAVLTAILGQTNLLKALFTAIEKGDVPAQAVNGDRRNQLMKHKDDEIRARAVALFKDLKVGDRMKIYEDYKSVLTLKSDAKNGHTIFTRTCASCHVYSGEGKTVGPDLTGIRNQPAEVLLLHIMIPEFEIMPIYTGYNVETKDGRTLSGLLAAETSSSITLRQALGLEERIQRADIASMTSSSLSLMPQELEKTMSKQELADLLGFLKGEEK